MVTPSLEAHVIERQADGGVDDPRVVPGAMFYPICMGFEDTGFLEGGDWTVIPYVRCHGQDVVTVDGPFLQFILM